jgi:hypothetical protein
MTGTDYNAIVNDLDKPTATVRPKGQPDRTHISWLNQSKLVMLTGNGYKAENHPCKRYVENAIIENDNDRKRFINRMDRIRNRKEKPFGG